MKEIVLATGNKHKVLEIKHILKDIKLQILSIEELGSIPEILENGVTLEENAVKKAVSIARHFNKWALADDTGLEVEYLHGAPGVYSARWAGPGCTYQDNNNKLINELKNVKEPDRKAVFRCVIALSNPEGKTWTVEGKIDGIISMESKGKNGFGYDPLFFIPEYNKTFAELDSSEKNVISHRGKALQKAKNMIFKHICHES